MTIIWLILSALTPLIYLGFRKAEGRSVSLADYQKIEAGITLLTDTQIDAAYKEAAARRRKRVYIDVLAVFLFELISLSALAVFRQRKEVLLKIESMICERKYYSRLRRELVPLP